MHLILFDDANRQNLLPFTHTRPVADIRCGIFTMRERWEKLLGHEKSGTLTTQYLEEVYSSDAGDGASDCLLVHGGTFADTDLLAAIQALKPGEALISDTQTIAALIDKAALPLWNEWPANAATLKQVLFEQPVKMLQRPWDIFSFNDAAIREDYDLTTHNRTTASIPYGVTVAGTEIFIEEGALIQPGTVINTIDGPVYLGKGVEIMEGCLIRGPFVLCDGAALKMGTKVYGGTTIGPGCKVGGEVSNVVFFANSNKGHDGFLGNAVIGEWCNLGADSNCSNLKNNYDEVKTWDEAARKSVKTGLTFCGLLMGDHSKCGINTMFNTGTVAGVSCNIWGGGFPEKFIPSFSWGGPEGQSVYQFNRAMETASRMMARRGKTLNDAERTMLQYVFDETEKSRRLMFGDGN